MGWYRFFRALFRVFYKVVYRWEIIGLDRIPPQGGVILCSNHISNLDPPFIATPLTRQVLFMAKEELFHVPGVSWLIKQFGAFPVKRGMSDRGALKKALEVLGEGHVLGIFPEGTRSKTGKLGEPYPGAALFALKSNAVVIPVAIIGSWIPFSSMKVVYGHPIDLSAYRDVKLTSVLVSEVSSQFMQEIQKLLDEHVN
ncbi:1-acyl-sn-glycerol-3-phosphate acyltransferase [Ammoniphilus sp. CFH 90114]|uniref:lysophospholipid acyltransferase family protein n=1 Tax=Ammoniphilus sp. CFH 90114 TaxID=2493665 RepID=UPI00100EADCE|nr:lysophospholipid acyltransferase family protein [Ammoniphilus sp. CFH 90114]RXT13885.1 1-acyl-sn-glycerol-3-phosphate acyltransferase [Ammoniphilus sp. CFH 90114]